MNERIRREYKRLRGAGWASMQALTAARTHDAWAEAEAMDLVRIECEPDCEDPSSVAPDYGNDRNGKRLLKAWRELVDREGVWMYAAQWRADTASPWTTADDGTICGVVGDEFKDSGYDVDMKRAALAELRQAQLAARSVAYVPEMALAAGWGDM